MTYCQFLFSSHTLEKPVSTVTSCLIISNISVDKSWYTDLKQAVTTSKVQRQNSKTDLFQVVFPTVLCIKYILQATENSILPVLCNFPQCIRASNEFVKCFNNGGKCWPVSSFFLPAVKH